MKKVVLKILGKHQYEGAEEEQVEFATEGSFHIEGTKMILTYEESELSGMDGCITRLELEGDSINMTRADGPDAGNADMFFKQGYRHEGMLDSPVGPIKMEILTNEVSNLMTEEGNGEITIDYSISLKGLGQGRNYLRIEVI